MAYKIAAKLLRLQYSYIKLLFLVGLVHTLAMQFHKERNYSENLGKFIQKYFSHESSLCVVQTGPHEESFLPKLSVPVVIFTAEKILQDCSNKLTDQDGYVFITSGAASLETQTFPLLQCFSQTTLRLKAKYILVVHFATRIIPNESDMYVSYFQKLWEIFGIANVAILPLQNEIVNNHEHLEFVFYNPFLAQTKSITTAVIRNNLTQDSQRVMNNRFCNMNGHKLKEVLIADAFQATTHKDLNEKKTLGANPGILYKNVFESSLNFTFEVLAAPNQDQFEPTEKRVSTRALGETTIGERISKNANLKIMFQLLSKTKWSEKRDYIQIGIGIQYVFIVPKSREIKSWRLFQYLFQWPVSAALGLAILILSVCAALFVYLQPSSHCRSTATQVASVLKAVFCSPINQLPKSHSQRFLITTALLLGLIVMTVSCARLFALIKSKPRKFSIKTLQGLQESNLPIYCAMQSNGFILDSFENTSLSKLRNNLKTYKVNKLEDLFNPKNLNITDHAVLYSLELVNLLTSLPENRIFLQYFDKLKESVLTDIMTINLPKGCLYYDHVNELNLRLLASGIPSKWFLSHSYYSAKRLASFSKTNQSQRVPKPSQTGDIRVPLKYRDLETAFFILYFGLAASAICFVLEICFARFPF